MWSLRVLMARWRSLQTELKMLNAILTRWARTRGASPTSNSSRFSTLGRSTTYPPGRSASQGADSIWQTLLRWIPGEADPWGAALPCQSVLLNNVPTARAAFEACLRGLHGDEILALQRSIQRSRSLRDLWHLRTWLYTEVARSFSQAEAELRLNRLNAHFQFGTSFGSSGPLRRGPTPARPSKH
jgi:hypothetical protein